MKRGTVKLLFCVLALGPGALSFPTGAGAIPAHQGQPADHPLLTTGPEYGHTGKPEPLTTGPAGNLHCEQGLTGEKPLNNTTATIPCLDPADQPQRFSMQLGRRTGSGSGFPGEFDGARVDYRLSGGLTLNGIAGYPVRSASDEFNTTRQVFGVSASTDTFARAWDLNSYFIAQQENAKADGRTVGGTLRHLRPGRSLLVFLDYDLAGNALGALTTSGAWRLPGSTTISATLDLRRLSPDTRQQKYLKHAMSTTQGWNWILPVGRLKHYTAGGAGEVSTLAVGLSRALSPRLQLNGDVAVLDAVKDTAADDAAALDAKEYLYHLKLTGKDLLLPGNSSRLDLRHSVREGARISTAAIDTRYDINRFWNITPAMRADYRSDAPGNSPRWAASPTVKMEYRWKKQHGFKIEAGGAWSAGEQATADNSRSPYFVNLGFQANF